jgi:hypothetical protein
MSAEVIKLKFPRRWTGTIHDREYVAKTTPSAKTQRACTMCGGQVRRSWRTGILHTRCRTCRYLILMYGPNITVELVKE